jgi:excisionase family DNA binding protein
MTRLLTVKEAAAYARVSQALVYEWCKEGRLAHHRLGKQGRRGKIGIDPSDLDAFLRRCKVTPGPAADPDALRHIRLPS